MLLIILSMLLQITVSRSIYRTGPANKLGRNSSSLAQKPAPDPINGICSQVTAISLKQTNLCSSVKFLVTEFFNFSTHVAS